MQSNKFAISLIIASVGVGTCSLTTCMETRSGQKRKLSEISQSAKKQKIQHAPQAAKPEEGDQQEEDALKDADTEESNEQNEQEEAALQEAYDDGVEYGMKQGKEEALEEYLEELTEMENQRDAFEIESKQQAENFSLALDQVQKAFNTSLDNVMRNNNALNRQLTVVKEAVKNHNATIINQLAEIAALKKLVQEKETHRKTKQTEQDKDKINSYIS